MSDTTEFGPDVWNEFGSVLMQQAAVFHSAYEDREWLSLLKLRAKFVPAIHPAGIHVYRDEEGATWSTAYMCKSQRFATLDDIDRALREPGIHYVLYLVLEPEAPIYRLRYGTVAHRDDLSLPVPPMTQREWLALQDPTTTLLRYPHRCPRCTGPAYVGLNTIDCARGCK